MDYKLANKFHQERVAVSNKIDPNIWCVFFEHFTDILTGMTMDCFPSEQKIPLAQKNVLENPFLLTIVICEGKHKRIVQ